jgi:SAM-dependent methyltransferase
MNIITPDIYKDFVPLPENLLGWNGDKPIFARLITEIKPKRVIEVGSWHGLSAITMAKALKELGMGSTLICVDTWLGAVEFWDDQKHTKERNLLLKHGYPQVYYQFLSNVVHNNVQDVILPFPNTSFIAAKFFKNTKYTANLIYIDGSHEYTDVISDCREYWDIVEPGGVMFGDDWSWRSVRTAVEDFAKEKSLKIERDGRDFWIFRKA